MEEADTSPVTSPSQPPDTDQHENMEEQKDETGDREEGLEVSREEKKTAEEESGKEEVEKEEEGEKGAEEGDKEIKEEEKKEHGTSGEEKESEEGTKVSQEGENGPEGEKEEEKKEHGTPGEEKESEEGTKVSQEGEKGPEGEKEEEKKEHGTPGEEKESEEGTKVSQEGEKGPEGEKEEEKKEHGSPGEEKESEEGTKVSQEGEKGPEGEKEEEKKEHGSPGEEKESEEGTKVSQEGEKSPEGENEEEEKEEHGSPGEEKESEEGTKVSQEGEKSPEGENEEEEKEEEEKEGKENESEKKQNEGGEEDEEKKEGEENESEKKQNEGGEEDEEKKDEEVRVEVKAPHYNWKDITAEFMASSSSLDMGELLHDSSFGLFEAMSAIEMMDPKMDAGMMCNQAKHPVLNLEQAIQAKAIKTEDPSMEEVIGIIDDTLACLVTWLEGHSLAQTVFTNLYLHDPSRVEDRPIKAFSICILKIVDITRERVNRASVFEEEDFQPMAYGFKLAPDITDLRATGMVKEAEEELHRIVKNTRSRAGEERDEAMELEHELSVAVHARLKFCRLILSTLLAFNKEKCAGIPDAQKSLTQLSELLPTIERTVKLGIKPAQTSDDTADYETIMGFEPLVNQRLLPPTFPRYTKIKKRSEMMVYLVELVERLRTVSSVTDVSGLHNLLDFFLEFSKNSPCVLSRSLLQLLVLPPSRRLFGTQNIVDVLRDTIRTFIAPPALMPKSSLANNAQVKEYVDACLTHAVRPTCMIFQITGHNRARQRDKWGHLLEDLANLQDEADKVDAFLHQLLTKVEPNRQHLACFGNWVLYHTLQVMIHYTLAGFELELYAVHEYHYVFWYLYECLYHWLLSTLSRADTFLLEQESISEQQQKRGSKKNKKKKKARPQAKEIVMAQAAQNLCGGYFKAIEGMTMDNKLRPPKFDFDSEEVRYNHRFAPFGNVGTPPPVPYSQFKEMTNISKYDPPPLATSFYSWSCKCFSQARTFYESLPNPSSEVQTMIKIAKTNFVVMKLLLGGHKKDSTESPEFDFSLHPVFPVIKLP